VSIWKVDAEISRRKHSTIRLETAIQFVGNAVPKAEKKHSKRRGNAYQRHMTCALCVRYVCARCALGVRQIRLRYNLDMEGCCRCVCV